MNCLRGEAFLVRLPAMEKQKHEQISSHLYYEEFKNNSILLTDTSVIAEEVYAERNPKELTDDYHCKKQLPSWGKSVIEGVVKLHMKNVLIEVDRSEDNFSVDLLPRKYFETFAPCSPSRYSNPTKFEQVVQKKGSEQIQALNPLSDNLTTTIGSKQRIRCPYVVCFIELNRCFVLKKNTTVKISVQKRNQLTYLSSESPKQEWGDETDQFFENLLQDEFLLKEDVPLSVEKSTVITLRSRGFVFQNSKSLINFFIGIPCCSIKTLYETGIFSQYNQLQQESDLFWKTELLGVFKTKITTINPSPGEHNGKVSDLVQLSPISRKIDFFCACRYYDGAQIHSCR